MSAARALAAWLLAGLLGACASLPPEAPPRPSAADYLRVPDALKAADVVIYAFGLMDIGYRFGGRNPDSGLDCSGMVSYIYEQVAGLRLPHNAAEIARLTRPVERAALRPGDLVFFNTLDRPFSHVGIYVGEERFVHAPSRNGRIQLSRLSERYYARRYEAARTLFAD